MLNAADFTYVFIVDRSGSMSGSRMRQTKKAMDLFIRSLPPQSKFQIISFGSSYSLMDSGNVWDAKTSSVQPNGVFEYNEANVGKALDLLGKFEADMGGTEILNPLKLAINELSKH
jgi:von Willebrand factor A domain-containing protein 5